jgi:hypothetical protein
MKAMLDGRTGIAGYAPMIVERGGGRSLIRPPRALGRGENMALYLLCDRGFVPTITLALETGIARNVRYDATLPFAQDTDFAIRLAMAGITFEMAAQPGAICEDTDDPMRVSSGRKGAQLIAWIEAMRSKIPRRAYLGCYGWTIAKGIARESRMRAFGLYLRALFAGCYRPRLAPIIFAQIFLPDGFYRSMADRVIGVRRR